MLAAIANDHELIVVEDDTEGQMKALIFLRISFVTKITRNCTVRSVEETIV